VNRVRGIRPLAALLAVTLAVALAGCGGSSGPSADSYVKSICTALSGWRDSVQVAGSALQSAATAGKHVSLAKGKESYLAFLAALLHATTSAASSLKAAGVPAVNGGKQVSTTLVQAFAGAQTALSGAAAQAARIPTTTAAAYATAASNVTSVIRTALAGMTAATPRSNPQLRAAAVKQPACSALKAAG
jgi:hypothetical protein